MNWPDERATESHLGSLKQAGDLPGAIPEAIIAAQLPPEQTHESAHLSGSPITVGKRHAMVHGKDVEVFTMTLGGETIDLLPQRNWGQLDVYKWRVRGKLPGTPAGLEITPDHVKLAGEVVSPKEPDACARLEKLFAEWLELERESLELAKKKAHAKPATAQAAALSPEQQVVRFQVELDKEDQVHIHCLQGKTSLATIGLNVPGFHSLVNQGFMRKPHSLKTGALHDWVELDGVLYSFEKGNNDSEKLAKALNETYLLASNLAKGKEVVVLANAASSTGFDIQFPARIGGMVESRRRPLGEDSLELLQDHEHCGLLHKHLVIRLTRPTLIFKQKTPDGSERYLEQSPENQVHVRDDDGGEKVIDLSRPVNYLRLSAVELTAVFNHPAINRHAKEAPAEAAPLATARKEEKPPAPAAAIQEPVKPATAHPQGSSETAPAPVVQKVEPGRVVPAEPKSPVTQPVTREAQPLSATSTAPKAAPENKRPPERKALSNLWLKPILEQQQIRYDWFTYLVYRKIAAWIGNSQEGKLEDRTYWFVNLGETEDMAHPDFKGIFLADNGGFGFFSRGQMVGFENRVLSMGRRGAVVEANDVRLVAVGVDTAQRLVFIVNGPYLTKFGPPEEKVVAAVAAVARLNEEGATLTTVKEALESDVPFEVVWSVPAEQANPADPEALESTRPGKPVVLSGAA